MLSSSSAAAGHARSPSDPAAGASPNELIVYDFRPRATMPLPSLSFGTSTTAGIASSSSTASGGTVTPPLASTSPILGPMSINGNGAVRQQHARSSSGSRSLHASLKIVQWNIERGYCLDAVIETLRAIDADILCLQELDIGCARSGGRNCAREIAEALHMKCAFAAEFLELDSSVRSERDGGGGLHGNAVLSHLDFTPHVLVHAYQAFDWERDGEKKREPRRGGRCTVMAEFAVPGFGSNTPSSSSSSLTGTVAAAAAAVTQPLMVYSAHLEVFCGMLARVAQFSEILGRASCTRREFPMQFIGADLNTMAHGIARFSPSYCTDSMRWRTLGSTEAEWLTSNVLAPPAHARDLPFNPALLSLNLPPAVVEAARNPGFHDPWDPVRDVTLSSHGGYYSGKLDWTLCMGLETVDRSMANLKYAASDHRALVVVVRPDPSARAWERYLRKWGVGPLPPSAPASAPASPVAAGSSGLRRRLLRDDEDDEGGWGRWGTVLGWTSAVAVVGAVAVGSAMWVRRHGG
ncbi:hypothetical protein BC828DRAFT_393888 [Blastocladiella britannica]|nr:hypothetical protein BC828DRAFT_393888 [Blastocladiella britannica]